MTENRKVTGSTPVGATTRSPRRVPRGFRLFGDQLLDCGEKVGPEERLHEKVVDSDGERSVDVGLLVACGQHEDAWPRSAVGEKLLGDAEAVEARHHPVEHDEIGHPLVDQLEPLDPVDRRTHLVSGPLQPPHDEHPDVVVIFDDEHAAHADPPVLASRA
jgi:hypothetical protein